MIAYFVLFSTAFLAATILPFFSEIVFFAMIIEGYNPVALLIVATIGNTLGSIMNWLLGLYLLKFQDKRWFYFSRQQITRAQNWFQKYGKWSLLMAWLPVGGDALTLVAGIMKVNFWVFTILVGTGKFLRYAFVLFAADIV